MKTPWDELMVFDAVMAAGSTLQASAWLGVPQSSVSRRFRAFCASHRVDVRRQGSGLHLVTGHDYVNLLRNVAQLFRLRTGWCVCAFPAELVGAQSLIRLLPGVVLVLDKAEMARINSFCESKIVDFVYEVGYSDGLDGLPFRSAPHLLSGDCDLDGSLSYRRSAYKQLRDLGLEASVRSTGVFAGSAPNV